MGAFNHLFAGSGKAIMPRIKSWKPYCVWLALSLVVSTAAGAATGRTEATSDVSATGAARYSIPIWVPPGTAGLQPELSISYDSSGEDGLLGMGFHISGLSSIKHCPGTIAQDGAASPFGSRYCLDGNRLRLESGTYGQAGAVYRTELETFSRIRSYGSAGPGPAYHIVENKDGLNTTDSRVEIAGGTTVRLWALNRIRDRSGNYIDFT